jgi:hypothetical protein
MVGGGWTWGPSPSKPTDCYRGRLRRIPYQLSALSDVPFESTDNDSLRFPSVLKSVPKTSFNLSAALSENIPLKPAIAAMPNLLISPPEAKAVRNPAHITK